MMERYQVAADDKDAKKMLLHKMLAEYRAYRERVFGDIKSAAGAAQRLEEISLHQSFLSNVSYIERLIRSEEENSRPNKEKRLQQLHHFKKMANTLKQAKVDPSSLTRSVSKYEENVLKAIKDIDEIKDADDYFNTDSTSGLSIDNKKTKKFQITARCSQLKSK